MVWISSEPVYPEKFHSLGLCLIRYPHINMIYAEDLHIPVWMWVYICVIFVSKDHNKGVSTDVDRILGTAHVICCVVDPKNIMAVYVVTKEYHTLAICIRECMFITIVWNIVVAGQQVVLQSWYEVLMLVSLGLQSPSLSLTLTLGSF
jgi:hypothetical protein